MKRVFGCSQNCGKAGSKGFLPAREYQGNHQGEEEEIFHRLHSLKIHQRAEKQSAAMLNWSWGACTRALPQASSVAPVVTTSSTSSTCFPSMDWGFINSN